MNNNDSKQTPQSSDERIRVKSPVSVNGAIGTTESFSEAVTEILDLLGSKGTTFETALFVLDKAWRRQTSTCL